ncbi:MAG TPA: hypothetical protein VGM94_08110 [Galbitalea sp.]
MTTPLRTKTALVTLAGIGLIGTLAGCSGAANADGAGSSGGSSSSSSGSTSSGTTTTSNATYKDGDYSEQGTYASPGGTELISVSLTLKSNVVTALSVKTVKADPTATQYEAMFEAGVGKIVVGKNLNSLNVTRVSGSSLTSQGFDDALTKIKADAKA